MTSETALSRLAERVVAGGTRSPERADALVALTRAVARRAGLSEPAVTEVCAVASLQDAGVLGVPAGTLTGEGELTAGQRHWIGMIPAIGESMVLAEVGDAALAAAVRAQHERWDGAGYPDRLRGDAIPLPSRITHVCEAYLAMTSDRPHRRAMSAEAAIGVLRMATGSQFCPLAAGTLDRVLAGDTAGDAPVPMPDPVPAAAVPSAAATRRRLPRIPVRWAPAAAAAAAGGIVGALLVLPLPAVATRCPPAGEGRALCTLQEVWAPALTIVAACVIGALLALAAVRRIPALRAALHAARGRERPAAPAFESDPVLAAASWGLTYRDVAGPLRRPVFDEPLAGPLVATAHRGPSS